MLKCVKVGGSGLYSEGIIISAPILTWAYGLAYVEISRDEILASPGLGLVFVR